jgi:hypothetical protein
MDIFESILERPKENLGRFCILMKALCGNKRYKYATEVLSLL